jgi:hypothetical protein
MSDEAFVLSVGEVAQNKTRKAKKKEPMSGTLMFHYQCFAACCPLSAAARGNTLGAQWEHFVALR